MERRQAEVQWQGSFADGFAWTFSFLFLGSLVRDMLDLVTSEEVRNGVVRCVIDAGGEVRIGVLLCGETSG